MRVPVATYRVQLNHAFGFRDLLAVTPYLADLGVTECYCSPILTARQGSTHGYDILDHTSLNPDIGTRADLDTLVSALRACGMGLIVDFVPNHMGIDPQANVWWRDVLEHGPRSPYSRFFDIDWRPVKEELRDKVLLAILGDQYGRVLERGELTLTYESGAVALRYFDRLLPINARQTNAVLRDSWESLAQRLGGEPEILAEFDAALDALTKSAEQTNPNETEPAAQLRARAVVRHQLAQVIERSPVLRTHIDAAVAAYNGTPGDGESFDRLHRVLEAQVYRLAYWRTAFDEINYRRFFDINDLAGLRMEDPRVFAATHGLLLDLVEQGIVTGIRLDHPDGLFDPTAYFQSLEAALSARRGGTSDVYLLIEKILGRGEHLRDVWPVHGTTGYGCLNTINGLFLHSDRLTSLRRHYREFTGMRSSSADTEYASKRLIMRTAMASELNVLANALNRISETDRQHRDFTLNGLRRALVEVIACFPVYRTYVSSQGATSEDIAVVDAAIAEAQRRDPLQEPSIFTFIRSVMLPPPADAGAAIDRWRDRAVAFTHKLQQYTAPVVAKGIEDTAFYNDVLILSANEVGGDLRHPVRGVAEFHRESVHRLTHWPLEMTAGSTHDTKRGEDARARINVISELPDEWRAHLSRWTAINEEARTRVHSTAAPDRNDEWMYYQALVGAWPAERVDTPVPAVAPDELVERMRTFMRKAMKEAKRHTSWAYENQDYENAVIAFMEATLSGTTARRFLASFVPLQRRLAWFGMLNSLAQLLLRLGAPGVPDIYQGSELWDFSLVDPDNRRPIDFEHRRRLLADVAQAPHAELLENWVDGRAKLLTISRALGFRRTHRDLFIHGEYEALTSDDDTHVVGFSRRNNDDEAIVVVPRFLAALMRGAPGQALGTERWGTTSIQLPRRLTKARLVNVITGESIEPLVHRGTPRLLMSSALQSWPVALLFHGTTREP